MRKASMRAYTQIRQGFQKQILYPCILAVLASAVLVGCGDQTPASPEGNSRGTAGQTSEVASTEIIVDDTSDAAPSQDTEATDAVLVLVADGITTLDPYRMVGIHPEGSIASHLWDTLTLLNNDLQIEPHLAESWRLINSLTWEFKLRQDVTFHNGEALDAEAVRFSIERATSMPGSLETFAKDVDFEQIEIVDDFTLRIITRQPAANLPFHLAFLEILPPVYYSETSLDRLAVAPVGSGPYSLDRWEPGQGVALVAVATYWKGAATLPRIVFRTVPRVEQRLIALEDFHMTVAADLPPMRIEEWSVPDSRLVAIESTQRMFIGIRVDEDSPFGDARVRQALNYGVNVEQIVDTWLEGYGERYGSWVNPPSNNQQLPPWPYDPDLARDLLREAGYEEGITTTLRVPIGIYHQDVAIANALAQQLAEIGVTVEVEAVDWTDFARQLVSGDVPPLFLLGLNSRGDGLEDTKNLSAVFAFSPTGWHNASFENALNRVVGTFNVDTRIGLLNETQEIAYNDAPWIWLWRQYDFYGVSQNLDWSPRRDGLVHLYEPATAPTELNK